MDTETQSVVLTERQRRVLWLLSVGRTRAEIVLLIPGETDGGVRGACARIYALLNSATAAQAVRNGLLGGHIGPYEDCGTLAAYRRHIKREEPTCPACKRGNRERAETEAALRNRRVRLNEAEVRLLRAFDAGRTMSQICTAWGVHHRVVKNLATSAYAALGVTHLPQVVRREAALREARMRGLLGVCRPDQPTSTDRQVSLSNTHVKILLKLETGASFSAAAEQLKMHPGTFSSRVSEAYKRLGVDWMDKPQRKDAALRKARALGLLPEPATT
jgi:DNA-binding NarL/FixJ family response regulator